jgi:hypothetical protein
MAILLTQLVCVYSVIQNVRPVKMKQLNAFHVHPPYKLLLNVNVHLENLVNLVIINVLDAQRMSSLVIYVLILGKINHFVIVLMGFLIMVFQRVKNVHNNA